MFLCLKCHGRYINRGWAGVVSPKPTRRGCERCQCPAICLDWIVVKPMPRKPGRPRKVGRPARADRRVNLLGGVRMKYRACMAIGLCVLFTSGCAALTDLDCSMEAGKRWAQSYEVRDGQCYMGPSAIGYADTLGGTQPPRFQLWITQTPYLDYRDSQGMTFCNQAYDSEGGPFTTCQ